MLRPLRKYFTRQHLLPVLGFGGVTISLAIVIWLALAGLASDYADYAAALDLLDRLEGRKPSIGSSIDASGMPGSPFLEGQTVTVAGAALLQRVASAITQVGGSVLSSQVELQGTQSKDGFVSLIASCEMDQASLQALLYDIEAGMPFLFVDQLVAQAPVSTSEGGRTRVLLAVSGLWPGAK